MGMIDMFRAEKCAGMKDEHGKGFSSYDACYEFMYKKCKPGKDKAMDGGKNEVTTNKGFCEEFFPEKDDKQKEADKKEMEAIEKKKQEEEKAAKKKEEEEKAAKKEKEEEKAAKKE